MTQNKSFTLGVIEMAGIGFVFGISGGAMASLAGGRFDTIVPYSAGFGAVAMPVLWFGIGVKLSRAFRRPSNARAVTSTTRIVA